MAGRSILIRFLGDSSSAKKASQETEAALGKVAPAADKVTKSTDKLSGSQRAFSSAANVAQKSVNGLASFFTSRMGPAGAELQKTIERATAGLGKNLPTAGAAAAKGLGEAEQGAAALSSGLGVGVAAGAAAAGAALAKMAIAGVKAQVDLATAVLKVKRATGETAQSASLLVGELKRSGVDVDSGTTALNRFAVNLDKSKATLQGLGVQIHLNTDGTVNYAATLDGLRQQYQATTDSGKQAHLANAAFGKGFQDLLPWLAKTTDQLKQYDAETQKDHGVLKDKDLQDAIAFKNSMRELGQTWQGLERELASGLIPEITRWSNELDGIIHKVDWINAHSKVGGHSLGEAAKAAVNPLSLLNKSLHAAGDLIHGTDGETVAFGDSLAKTGADAQTAADKIAEDEAAVTALRAALEQATSADKAFVDGQKAITDAQSDATNKIAIYNDLLKKGVVDAKAVAAADRDLADAKDTLADKQDAYQRLLHTAVVDEKAVAQATKDRERTVRSMEAALNAQLDAEKALYNLEHPNARTLTDAKLDQQQAQNDATRAMMGQSVAHQTLQRLEQSGKASADELAQARLDASDADIAATRATERLHDAEKAQYDLTPTGIRQTQEYKDATKAVADAKQAAADAADAERQADTALATAKLGDTNRTRELRDAEREVRDAQDKVKDSTDKLAAARDGDAQKTAALAKAADDAKTAEDHLHDAQAKLPDLALAAADAHVKLATAVGNAGANVSTLVGQLRDLEAIYPQIKPAIDQLLHLVPGQGAPRDSNALPKGDIFPGYDEGGMVPGPVGRPQLAIVHGGERVLTPEEQQGAGVGMPSRGARPVSSTASAAAGGLGPVSVTLNVFGIDDPERLAAKLERPLRAMLMRAAGDRQFVDRLTTEQVRNRKRNGPANL